MRKRDLEEADDLDGFRKSVSYLDEYAEEWFACYMQLDTEFCILEEWPEGSGIRTAVVRENNIVL